MYLIVFINIKENHTWALFSQLEEATSRYFESFMHGRKLLLIK